jgi:predicted nuclease of predicted toxin-antitoxin system
MKLLLDENISPKLAAKLSDIYPDSAHVRQFGLTRKDDLEVWRFGKANGFAIVSKDSDFNQFSLLWGHPPKVICVRLGNCTTVQIAELLRSRSVLIHTFNEDPDESLLVLP